MSLISLSSIKNMAANDPPRVLIYGTPGIGKTTLAAEFPNPIFLQLEGGTPAGVEIAGWDQDQLPDFPSVMSALEQLYNEDHDFKTLVVDSVTELQRYVFAETCARGDEKGNAKKNIEDFGYGKGYVYAQKIMHEFIDGISLLRRERRMNIVLIAHSTVERFDDPETVSYDRYEIDLHGKLVGMVERDMDAILLVKKPVTIKEQDEGFNKSRARADGGASTIFIHTAGRPAYVAKNRYDMPEQILYRRGEGYAALSKYFPQQPSEGKKGKAA